MMAFSSSLESQPGRAGLLACVLAMISGCYCSHARPEPDAAAPDGAVADVPSAPDVPLLPDAPDAPDAPPQPGCFDEPVVAVVDSSLRASIWATSVTPIPEGWLVTYQHHIGFGAARLDREGRLIDDFRPFESPSFIVRVADALIWVDYDAVHRVSWGAFGPEATPPVATGDLEAYEVVGDTVLRTLVTELVGGERVLTMIEVRPDAGADLIVTRGRLAPMPDVVFSADTFFLLEDETLYVVRTSATDDARASSFRMDLSALSAGGGTVGLTPLDDAAWSGAPNYLLGTPVDGRVVSVRFDAEGAPTATLENLPHGTRPGTPTTTWPLGPIFPRRVLLDPARFTVIGDHSVRTYARSSVAPIADVMIDPAHEGPLAGQDGDVLAVVYTESHPEEGRAQLWIRCTVLPPAP
jgi:hypothetical protein